MGGSNAGMIGFLTLLSSGCKVVSAVSYSANLSNLLTQFNIPTYDSIEDRKFLKRADLLLSVHGREIVKFDMPKINVHPYLYKYKGAFPLKRALRDRNFFASVGSHYMTNKVDDGEVITEHFQKVKPCNSEEEIYNQIYHLYIDVILETIGGLK